MSKKELVAALSQLLNAAQLAQRNSLENMPPNTGRPDRETAWREYKKLSALTEALTAAMEGYVS